ncbi:hypothetical protein FSP39_022046 [Pinctada imbricata]|uniref:Uncharacterized protein n=1 Tax=Pinctada imbricata TaxID=66713 RepID=A0AA88XJW8_PINIB|nr:hypothetical protein FSP39_022046 [Pinctada imbricata]
MFRSYIVSQFRDEDLENTISSTLPPSSNTGNMSHAYEEVIDSTSQSINSTISSFDEKQGQCQLLPSDTQRSKKLDIVLQQEVHGSSAYECIYVRMESGELNFVDREKIADLQYVNKPSVSNSDFTRYAGDEMRGESLRDESKSQESSGIESRSQESSGIESGSQKSSRSESRSHQNRNPSEESMLQGYRSPSRESRSPKSSRSESRSHRDKIPCGKSMSQRNSSPSEESRSRESISSESRKGIISDHDLERMAYNLAQEFIRMRKMEEKEENKKEKVEKCDASTNTDSDSDSSTSLCNAISLQPKSSDVSIEVKAMSVDSGSQE